MPATARPRPCASCPYRKDVPSGVWEASEYEKLPAYDLPTGDQPPAAFYCHQADGFLCSGWLGCHETIDLLGLRLGVAFGHIDPSVYDYETDVPLWGSGTEAAIHGLSELEEPSPEAQRVIDNLLAKRRG